MKKGIVVALMAVFAVVTISPAFGQITIRAPRASTDEDGLQGLVQEINDELAGILEGEFKDDLEGEIENYFDLPKLGRGVANSGALATHIGTQRSFIDYRRFAVVVGAGGGLSAPTFDPDRVENVIDDLEEDGDIYFGLAAQPIVASFGFRPRFISDRLYMNAKLGWANFDEDTLGDGLSYNSMSVGLLANYVVLQPQAVGVGALRWRGLSLGSGLVYQRNELEFELTDFARVGDETDDRITIPEDNNGGNGDSVSFNAVMDPVLLVNASSNSFVIPLEATTGLRVLWILDLNVGGGIDVSFGSSEITLDVDSPIRIEDVDVDVNNGDPDDITFTDGAASVSASTDEGPQLVRPRLTAGAGLSLGPLRLDFPLMYYFDADGNSLMAGVNLGIVW